MVTQAKAHSKATIIGLVRGQDKSVDGITPKEKEDILLAFKTCLRMEESDELSAVTNDELLSVFDPESLLERFAAKKANKVGKNNDFLTLKGNIKGQIEMDTPAISE